MVEGEQLPELAHEPITRATLALFAGASHDHVPLHIDSDFAKAAGMDDVFAHGMLSMAYLAQALRRWAPADRLRTWERALHRYHPAPRCCALPRRSDRDLRGRRRTPRPA